MAGYHGDPRPDPTKVIRPKPPSSAPVLIALVLTAVAGIGAFFWLASKQDAHRSQGSQGCVDTVYDVPASVASNTTSFQCSPQQAVQVTVAPDGHRVIACRCRSANE